MLFSQVGDQFSGAVVIAIPPSQLKPKRPSLSRLPLYIELVLAGPTAVTPP